MDAVHAIYLLFCHLTYIDIVSSLTIDASSNDPSVSVTLSNSLVSVDGTTWKLQGSPVTDWAIQWNLDPESFAFPSNAECTLSFAIDGQITSDGDMYFGFGDGSSFFIIFHGGSGGVATHSDTIDLGTFPGQNAALATGDVRALLDGFSTSDRSQLSSQLCDGNGIDELIGSDSDTFPFYIDITNDPINGLSQMSWQNGGRSGVRQFASAFLADSTLFLTALVDPQGDKTDFYDLTVTKQCSTAEPTRDPTDKPSVSPSREPTSSPSKEPTAVPTESPTASPTMQPTLSPSNAPSAAPSNSPSLAPSSSPSTAPTMSPTMDPTREPTADPTIEPTVEPTADPTLDPTVDPTAVPTRDPTAYPTFGPTVDPTHEPTTDPTRDPTVDPTSDPTADPTAMPTAYPTSDPTDDPTTDPTQDPTADPTRVPSVIPSADPSTTPTQSPSTEPTLEPTADPTMNPSAYPTALPTTNPTMFPSTSPTAPPSTNPTTVVASDGLENNLISGEALTELGWALVGFSGAVVLLVFVSFWLILRHCGARKAMKQNVDMLSSTIPGITPGTAGNGQTEAGATEVV